MLQQLWAARCSWDEPIPVELLEMWRYYHRQLPEIENVSIPRWTQSGHHSLHQELHGFSDASTKAYAAVVYLRVIAVDGTITVTLLAAKSKVAPIKTMTVPRLELSAALLLARLLHFICTSLDLDAKTTPIHCRTDSRITLAWLSRAPAYWKTFVANRVAEIKTLLPNAIWHHVSTNKNPADCVSRGISPEELASNTLWWSGPSWLAKPEEHWPTSDQHLPPVTALEERSRHAVVHTTTA
ncbi:uncharacterized protein LOC112454878, partial [Temnothorax curvispinosus]|uniref:Uncharacterized protein LOC112454878 n=1 Tax=Temnothorax curvispinosus TaxID=300111 RepID=A0A6J1PRA3_9HYME